jgi:protein disulfide-isomerase-like protein
MAANNNTRRSSTRTSSRNNNTTSSSSLVNNNTLMWICLLVVIILVIVALYYMQKKRAEGFENNMNNKKNNKTNKNTGSSSNIKPAQGECVVALFYADWCGHCQSFKPEFEKAMEKLNGQTDNKGNKLRLIKVDCDVEKALAKEYDVSGYPTVKILYDDGTVSEYGGERSYEGLRKYLVSDN